MPNELDYFLVDRIEAVALLERLVARCDRMMHVNEQTDDDRAWWHLRKIRCERALDWLRRD